MVFIVLLLQFVIIMNSSNKAFQKKKKCFLNLKKKQFKTNINSMIKHLIGLKHKFKTL